ncbi:MAG: hypothetical protein IIZ25_11870, partial [Thermoguttaceae bacterium]|nr:hypothetical protein [Thermoguttaceae bacterium]
KEGAWAAFQGFLTMYEVTGQQKYLDDALHAGAVCLSYLVVWDIPLPPGRLSDHAFKSRGWTVVSVQNQHLDVYGVLFAPEVKRLGELTGIDSFKKVSEVMFPLTAEFVDQLAAGAEHDLGDFLEGIDPGQFPEPLNLRREENAVDVQMLVLD